MFNKRIMALSSVKMDIQPVQEVQPQALEEHKMFGWDEVDVML